IPNVDTRFFLGLSLCAHFPALPESKLAAWQRPRAFSMRSRSALHEYFSFFVLDEYGDAYVRSFTSQLFSPPCRR
ncbi:MAG: hypothetical protein RRA94_02055, partial [Bacteroidota bacterium]|nr:hypothetical protein [Bacteroidota bacterium]